MVKGAFGEDEERADAAFFSRSRKTISGMVAEHEEDESLPPVQSGPAETVADLAADADVPETVREQIGKSFAHVFGEVPPAAHNVLDNKLVEEGTRRAHTAQLEQKVAALQQELAAQAASQADGDDTPLWDGDSAAAPIELRVPAEKGSAHPYGDGKPGRSVCCSSRSMGTKPRASTERIRRCNSGTEGGNRRKGRFPPFTVLGGFSRFSTKCGRPAARETVKIHVFGRIALKTGEKVCYTTNI